jgi:type VI protein secretion system component VasF
MSSGQIAMIRQRLLGYLQKVRNKARETIARESGEVLAGPSGFRRQTPWNCFRTLTS